MQLVKRWLGLAGLAVAASAVTTTAFGLAAYPPALPNGTVNSCSTCHLSAGGGGIRNAFGNQIPSHLGGNGLPNWATLYSLDADNDGFTNGEELGDPCGVWVRGGPAPAFTTGITKPGDMASVPAAHTLDSCNAGSSSSAAGSSMAPASSGGGTSSSSGGTSSSSGGASSSTSDGGGGSGGCCGGGNEAARATDLSLLAIFALLLRRRAR